MMMLMAVMKIVVNLMIMSSAKIMILCTFYLIKVLA